MRFEKGRSGNPGGRPKLDPELRALARQHAPEAIRALLRVMRSKRSPAAAVVMAAREILDRGYGRAVQAVDWTGQVTLADIICGSVRQEQEERNDGHRS